MQVSPPPNQMREKGGFFHLALGGGGEGFWQAGQPTCQTCGFIVRSCDWQVCCPTHLSKLDLGCDQDKDLITGAKKVPHLCPRGTGVERMGGGDAGTDGTLV